MFAKFFLLALLTFSAQTLSEAKSIEAENYGLIEEINKIFEQLIAFVQDILSQGLVIINELYENLQEQAKEELAAAFKQLQDLINSAKAKLQEILAEVEELGEEAKQCVSNEEDNILALADKTKGEMEACRNELLASSSQLVNSIRAGITANIDSVKGLLNDWNTCSSILCKIGVISRIETVISTIRSDITRYTNELKEFVATAVPAYNKCSAEALAIFAGETNEIRGRIEVCLKNIN